MCKTRRKSKSYGNNNKKYGLFLIVIFAKFVWESFNFQKIYVILLKEF